MNKMVIPFLLFTAILSQEEYSSSCPSNEWIQIPEEQRRIITDFNDAALKFWTDAYPESGWDKESINTTIENTKNIVLLIEKYDNLKPSIIKDPDFDIKVFEGERERMILFFLDYFFISVSHLREEEYGIGKTENSQKKELNKHKVELYDQSPERRQLQLTQLDIRILALVEGYYNKLEERASESIMNEFNAIHYEYMLELSKKLARFYRSTVFAAENGDGKKEGYWREKTFNIYQEIYNHSQKEFLLKNIGKISNDCLPSSYIVEKWLEEEGLSYTDSEIEIFYPNGFFEIEYITFLNDYLNYKKNRVGIINHHEIFKAYDLALNSLEGLSLSEVSKIIQRKNELISDKSSNILQSSRFIIGFDSVGGIPKHHKNEFLYCMYAEVLDDVYTIKTYYSLIGDEENELESLVYALEIYGKIDEDLLFELADTNPMLGISYLKSIGFKSDYFDYRAIDLSLMDKDVFSSGKMAGFVNQKGRVILKEMDEYYNYIRHQFDKIENTILTKRGWQQESPFNNRTIQILFEMVTTRVNEFGDYVKYLKIFVNSFDESLEKDDSIDHQMADIIKSRKKEADNDDWIGFTAGMIFPMYFDDLDAPKNSSEEKERRERIDSFLGEIGETRDSFFKIFREWILDIDRTNVAPVLWPNQFNKLLDNDPYSKSPHFAFFPDTIFYYLDLAKSLKSREEYQNILNSEVQYILKNFTVENVQKDYDFSITFGNLLERIDKDVLVYSLENECDNHINGPYRIMDDDCGLIYFFKRIIALDSLRGILTEKNVNQSLGEYTRQYDNKYSAMAFSTLIDQLINNQALIFYDFSKTQPPGQDEFRFVYQYEIFMIKKDNKGNLLFTNYSSSLEDKEELINLFYRFGLVEDEATGAEKLLVDERSILFTDMLQRQISTPNHAALFEIDNYSRTHFSTNYTALNLSLYTLLVKPIRSFIDESDYLTIIPDPVISNIPFETLLDWDDEENIFDSWNTLLDKFVSINYANSFREFMENVSISNTPKRLNLFGNINYEAIPNDILSKRGYKNLDNLEWSKNEIYDIDKIFSGSTVIEGNRATETKFKRTDFRRFDAIHFAMHGVNIEDDYQKSALIFLGDSSNDGMLTFEEIIKLDLNNIDLVTLSACSTNRSKLFSGFSHLSLQHAFKLAGAQNVISTMWEIDDKASYYFMKEYYQLLKKHKNPSITLSITKRHFIKKYPQYASPHYWGAFVNYGSY